MNAELWRLTLPAAPAADIDGAPAGPVLSVIVPTRNERPNIEPLFERLSAVLDGIAWEAIYVDDDSTDGTVEAVRALAQRDARVRLVHRIGRRGLSSACIEAAQASTAPYFAVIDADLQHDESLLPHMFDAIGTGDWDLVVGSRYVPGGGTGDWEKGRVRISDVATRLGRLVLRVDVKDPMSGFFMMRRESFDGSVRRLSALGFKILLDIIASSPRKLRILELPYQFRPRLAGESKLDAHVAWEYLMLLADKTVGKYVPVRFVFYCGIGTGGLVVHLATLQIAINVLGASFLRAQAAASLVAMLSNFVLNNLFTYSDRRLKGWRLVKGLVSFSVICSVAWIANLSTAQYLYDGPFREPWWIAGVAGAVVSAVWNYAVSSVITWRRR